MESNPLEDTKSSSEEAGSEQANDDIGTGRSYECVFCKRGFTTAQALGGHMNIHRKDRAKNRPNSVRSISDKVVDENYANLIRSYAPAPSYPGTPHFAMAPEVHVNYQTFFPASTWDERSQHTHHTDIHDSYGKNSQHLNLFGDEIWRENLTLTVGPSNVPVDGKRDGVSADEDELDLELRLGHHDP